MAAEKLEKLLWSVKEFDEDRMIGYKGLLGSFHYYVQFTSYFIE
jgi:hypothetical protein